MDFKSFSALVKEENAPENLNDSLLALWYDAKDKWEKAHAIAQQVPDPEGAWVHAYLHRVEGDLSNAEYWYKRAGKPVCRDQLTDEWESIVCSLLESN
tara:strand:+ start:358 stop:651 length:294 start_codon:yes stop_codon:yes gene_type:complete